MRLFRYRFAHACKRLYVAMLLALLPLILSLLKNTQVLRREITNLPPSFTFALKVASTSQSKTITLRSTNKHQASSDGERTQNHASFSSTPNAAADFTIEFVSVDDAFDVFFGNKDLRQAIALHALSTQGNINQGVSLTYLFNGVLKTFFFWRSTYARV